MVQVRSSGLTFFTYCGSSVGRLVGTVQSGEIDLTSVFTTTNTRQIFSTSGTGASQAFVPGNAFSPLKVLVPGQGYAIVGKLAFDFPQGLPSSSEGSLTQALRAIGSAVATTQGKPYAVINASATAITTGTTVNFTATGSTVGGSGIIIGYDWNFGTGNGTSVSNAPSVTFNNPGTFLVTLRVLRDSDNVYSERVTRAIVVTGSPVSPTPNPNPPGPIGPSPTPPSGSITPPPSGPPEASGWVLRSALPANSTIDDFWIGNSVSDTKRDSFTDAGLDALAATSGDTYRFGRDMIPGAPLEYVYNNSPGFTTSPYGGYANALANYKWKTVTFQPFDRAADNDLQYIRLYLDIVAGSSQYANSSEFPQPWVYQRWPRKRDESVGPNDANFFKAQFDRTYVPNQYFYECRDFFNTLINLLRTNETRFKPVLQIPVGECFYRYNELARTGAINSPNGAYSLYSDGIHLTLEGSYFVTVIFYAAYFFRSPVGLSVPSGYGTIPSDRVSLFQTIAWDVVSTNPFTAYVKA